MNKKEFLEWLNEDGDFINLRRLLQDALNEARERLKELNYPEIDARIVLDYFKRHSKNYDFASMKSTGGLGFFRTSFKSLANENILHLVRENDKDIILKSNDNN